MQLTDLRRALARHARPIAAAAAVAVALAAGVGFARPARRAQGHSAARPRRGRRPAAHRLHPAPRRRPASRRRRACRSSCSAARPWKAPCGAPASARPRPSWPSQMLSQGHGHRPHQGRPADPGRHRPAPRPAGRRRAARRRLIGLSLRTGPASAITLSRSFDGALRLRELDEKLRDETTVADGAIQGSLYESAEHIGATPQITAEVAKLFAHKLDFQRDIQPGDAFRLVFDRKVTEAGRTVEAGDLQYAEIARGQVLPLRARRTTSSTSTSSARTSKASCCRPRSTARTSPRCSACASTRSSATPAPTRASTSAPGPARRSWRPATAWWRRPAPGAATATGCASAIPTGWDTGYGHISRYAAGIHPGVHVHQGQVVAYVGRDRPRDRPAPALRDLEERPAGEPDRRQGAAGHGPGRRRARALPRPEGPHRRPAGPGGGAARAWRSPTPHAGPAALRR